MTTVLLVLPTGTYRAAEYLDAARRLGVTVITGSDRPQALLGAMGKHFVELPLDDPLKTADAIVRHAAALPVDAVVAVDDTGALGAAEAAGRLGLRHNPTAAVATTRDKIAMRRAFADAGVPQPDFAVALSDREVLAAAERIGFPVVVKPPSLAGSRGVIRADDRDGLLSAAAWTRRILTAAGEPPDGPLLVEQLVTGAEVALEGICSGGHLDVICVFDKPEPLEGPYFEETIYVTPSRLDPAVLESVQMAAAAAVEAIGLREGPVHAELRAEGPRVLEVAARTIGGRCSKALSVGGGHSLEELVISRAAGVAGPAPELDRPAGILMVPIPRSGHLEGVRGIEAVRALPHVTGVEITIPRGKLVRALPEGERYLGFAFAAADTPEEVETALRAAEALLEVDISEVAEPPGGPATVA